MNITWRGAVHVVADPRVQGLLPNPAFCGHPRRKISSVHDNKGSAPVFTVRLSAESGWSVGTPAPHQSMQRNAKRRRAVQLIEIAPANRTRLQHKPIKQCLQPEPPL